MDPQTNRSPATAGLSCQGVVWHVRGAPRRHAFRYAVWMVYVDLEQVARAEGRGWVVRPEHLLTPAAVQERLVQASIDASGTRIYALTQPGSFGYSFNP